MVRIKLKNMDVEIRRRESTGSGANTHVETETLAKFELMDGAPVRGTSLSSFSSHLFLYGCTCTSHILRFNSDEKMCLFYRRVNSHQIVP